MEEVMPDLDALYMTRIQRERFEDEEEYERLKDSYILTSQKLAKAKEKMCVLHPLPRVNEISHDVDKDPRAAYFDQVKNGKLMRMALIMFLLARREEQYVGENAFPAEHNCRNKKCISYVESHLPALAIRKTGAIRCYYCESKLH